MRGWAVEREGEGGRERERGEEEKRSRSEKGIERPTLSDGVPTFIDQVTVWPNPNPIKV